MSLRFKRPLVGAAGQGLSLGNEPPRSQALIMLLAWALLLAVYLQGGGLPAWQAPVGVLGSRWGRRLNNQRWFKKGGMKGDLVLYDSQQSRLVNGVPGGPPCLPGAPNLIVEGCLCSRAWEPTALAGPALNYPVLPFRPAIQCPTVSKLHLPLRTHS